MASRRGQFFASAEAPDVPVQIAHLAGVGRYDERLVDGALRVFADAVTAKDKRMKRVYFDVSVAPVEPNQELIVKRLRTLGMGRILYGSDSPPLAAWRAFRKLPLTEREFRRIETNRAPYFSGRR